MSRPKVSRADYTLTISRLSGYVATDSEGAVVCESHRLHQFCEQMRDRWKFGASWDVIADGRLIVNVSSSKLERILGAHQDITDHLNYATRG